MRIGSSNETPIAPAEYPALLRYSVAVFAVAAAAGLRLALHPLLGGHAAFLPFTLAVVVATHFGGRGPGLSSAALGLFAAWYVFLEPRYSFALAHRWDLVAVLEFAAVSLVIIGLSGKLRQMLTTAAEGRAAMAALMDSSAQAIIATTGDGRIALVNARTESMFGYSPGELLGMPHDVLIPERLRERHQRHHASFVVSPRPRDMSADLNLVGRRKDGAEFPVEITLNSVRTARGLLSVSFVTDITERRRMEENFRRQYSLMRTITESAAEGLILVDSQGRVTFANPAAEQLLGWTAEELLGAVLHDRIHYQRPDGTPFESRDCPLEQVLATAQAIRAHETVFFRKDGAPVPVSNSVAPIFHDGKVAGAVVVVSDITQRRQSEEALRQSEQRVRLKLESILSPEGDIGNLELGDILDVKAIQSLADDFYQLTAVPMRILDLKGNILVGVGWSQVCTEYHRRHPETSINCMESDTKLSAGVDPAEFKPYKCLNHMWDMATPLMIGNEHVGNLFCGQFFFEDEATNLDLFRSLAARFGFPEEQYLAAIQAAPRLSRKTVETGMAFLTKLGQMLSLLSYSNIKLARLLAERDRLMGELKAEQEKLKESEERSRLAIESTGLGVFDADLETGTVVWSAVARQQFGLPPDAEVDYQVFMRGLHPDDRARVELVLAEARHPLSGGTYVDEYRAIGLADGRERWFSAWGRVFFDEQQRPIRLLGVRRDITDRKHAEEALRDSEERFRALVTASSDVVYRMSPDWSEMRQLHGRGFLSDTEAPSRAWLPKYVPPCDQPLVLAAIGEAIRTRSIFELEHKVLRVDGSLGWTFSRAIPLRNAHGEIIEWFGAASDITQRKQAEEALHSSEQQFRTLANAIPQLCWMANADGGIFWYNERWYQYTGTTPEQMEGWGWQSVHHAQALPKVLERWKASIATGDPFDMVFPLRGRDGIFRPFLTRIVPVRDRDGKVARWFGTNTDISEQRKIEEALRESEQRYRALFESMQQSFVLAEVICGPAGKPVDWRYLDVNPAFESAFGRQRAEIVGRTYGELFPGAPAREYWVSGFGEVALTGRPAHLLQYGVGGRQFEATAYSPKIGQFAAVLTDVTERKRAEAALRRSEERFRILFESMDEGFASCEMIYDEDGRAVDFRYLLVNPAFGRLTGLPAAQVSGRTVRDLIPAIEPFWIETYGRVAQTGQSERVAHPVVGLGRWLEVFAWRPAPGQFAVVFSDITERRRTEQTLRRLSELVDLSHDAIITMGADRVIQTWNAGAAELYGWTRNEAVGQVTPGLLQTHAPVGLPEQDEVLQRNGRWDGELADLAKDGTLRWVDSCQVLQSAEDATAILEINRDITARKRAEEDLQRLNAELEQRVRDRTAQLEAANRELESFAYSVSHDLRAPLRGIDGWSLALLEDYHHRLDEDGRKQLAWVRSEAQRMGAMIEDLLQLSRVTRSPMQQAKVDLAALAAAVARRLRESAPDRSLAFQIRPGLSAWGDERLLEIALTNLLENAVKYTGPRAEARIEVGEAPHGNAPAFYVKDNGVGFDPAYADKLFTAFQRLHKPSEFPGTGIGLATVQRIIHRHGGRVWAHAVPEQGATFFFTLPEADLSSAETQ